MLICVSYLTNTMPIIGGGGGGGGPASFLPMPMKNTGCHSGNIYADILIFANATEAWPKNFVKTPGISLMFRSNSLISVELDGDGLPL